MVRFILQVAHPSFPTQVHRSPHEGLGSGLRGREFSSRFGWGTTGNLWREAAGATRTASVDTHPSESPRKTNPFFKPLGPFPVACPEVFFGQNLLAKKPGTT